jgi:predicted metalloprotease with PDZ domain
MLNGAPTFMTPAGSAPRPHEVALELPAGWAISETGLPPAPGGAPHRYLAADYDTLVDSPLYAGSAETFRFEVEGKPHVLVNEGGGGIWDGPQSARDVETIVREQAKFWGHLPYDKYVFFNILSETGGGLEHKNSTVLMGSRWATRTRPAYLGWLNLVSHEFFHTWNVKRLRPAELGPFDYENEVHTRSLWVAEGITSYYDRLLVRRAGLCTLEEYLAGDPPRRGQAKSQHEIEQVQSTPGRLVQGLEDSSFDAWIKFYRRDENTPNTQISYYLKGSVVAFLLDARIRRLTDGQKSLDDVMRRAYELYSGDRGFTPEEFRGVVNEVAGSDFSDWFRDTLESTKELDYGDALAWYGLRFAPPKPDPKDEGGKAWLGLETKNQGGLLLVDQVRRGTPGFDAGFNVGDEIVGIGDDRVSADQWGSRLEAHRPGDKVSVLIARRGRLRRLEAVLGREPGRDWVLEVLPDAAAEATGHLRAWLAIPEPTAAPEPKP